jgi:hypothetical protein
MELLHTHLELEGLCIQSNLIADDFAIASCMHLTPDECKNQSACEKIKLE